MKRNTKRIGDISEAVLLTAFIQAGYSVAVPFGENQRWDFVKIGRLRNGAILFNCFSVHADRSKRIRTCSGEIEDVPRTTYGSVRWMPTKNGQSTRVRWAGAYTLSKVSLPKVVGIEPGDAVTSTGPGVPL